MMKFIIPIILILWFGSLIYDSDAFNAVDSNQNELIEVTKAWSADNETDLVISNGTVLTPEISIPYIGGIIKSMLYFFTVTGEMIALVFHYFTAFIELLSMIPPELAPLVIIGILGFIFMVIAWLAVLLHGR